MQVYQKPCTSATNLIQTEIKQILKNQIIENLENPEIPEDLFRADEAAYHKSFAEVSAVDHSDLVNFWRLRLMPVKAGGIMGVNRQDLVFILAIALAAGLWKAWRKGDQLAAVERTIPGYLTVSAVWTMVAVFWFPLVFGMQ